jgi:hypothetical protein
LISKAPINPLLLKHENDDFLNGAQVFFDKNINVRDFIKQQKQMETAKTPLLKR